MGLDRTSTLRGGCRKRGGNFFQGGEDGGGCNFTKKTTMCYTNVKKYFNEKNNQSLAVAEIMNLSPLSIISLFEKFEVLLLYNCPKNCHNKRLCRNPQSNKTSSFTISIHEISNYYELMGNCSENMEVLVSLLC